MADPSTTPSKRGGKLPPITGAGDDEENKKPKKKVVKKKKPKEDAENEDGEKPKAAPRKKKAATSADTTATDGENKTVPKKKKKVVKKKTDEQSEGDPTSARSGGSQGEDVDGSKASLIKSPKDGTPRKKKVKKKVKKTTEKSATDDIFDSTLAADLSQVQDDIVAHDDKKDDEDEEDSYMKQPYSTASNILRSQPTEKFYIETDSGFKGENKTRFAKRQIEEAKEKAIVREEPSNTTIEFAISTQKVFRTFCLFCHGLLAGFAVWHIVVTYVLLDFGNVDFIVHYRPLALPVQCIFYILLVLCTVSSSDRFDIGMPKRGFLLKAVTLQNGTISVLIYFAALVVSLANGALEDKIHMYHMKPYLWNNTAAMDNDVNLWTNLNTARNSLSILGWFVISLVPVADRLVENLRQTDAEELLGVDVETGKATLA